MRPGVKIKRWGQFKLVQAMRGLMKMWCGWNGVPKKWLGGIPVEAQMKKSEFFAFFREILFDIYS